MTSLIRTFTGLEVDPLHMKMDEIRIEDIAHGLALCNRFAGHSRYPISVAQHSVLVSLLSGPEQLVGLLHDASEAYLGDVTKWLKEQPEMEAYRAAELELQDKIYVVFGIYRRPYPNVKWADRIAVRFEFEMAYGCGQKIANYSQLTWSEYKMLTERISREPFLWQPMMSWQEAEAAFLQRYRDLKRRVIS